MRLSTAVILASSVMLAQAPPPPPAPPVQAGQPRDVVRRPEPTGTGVIRGRVVAADSGNPVRRANVNLVPVMPPPALPPPGNLGAPVRFTSSASAEAVIVSSVNMGRPRTATTDAQGHFEFTGLPAGGYRLTANPGQYAAGYLGIAYGGKRPMGPGSVPDPGATIDLAEGQRFDRATIALPRGAVVSGRVADENGDPLARVQVYSVFYAPGSSRGQRMGMSAQTDDLGHFRLYGLTPGEYVVVAEAREATFVPPNAPPEREEDKIGFMTTYYPGTADEASAQRVRARAGTETPGVEIRMATGRLFRVSGMVTDSQGRTGPRVSGQLLRRSGTTTAGFGFSTDEQGRFQMRNIPPGNYRLVVRGRAPGPEGPQSEPPEMGTLPIAVNTDLEGLVVMTSPGATITGQVTFEQGPPQLLPGQQSFQMRVTGSMGDPEGNVGMSMPPPALVTPDLTFTMRGLHGELLLRSSGPGMYLRAVTVGGRDVTDTPHEFKNGDQVTLVMSSRASTLEGSITDAAGKPVLDAAVLVFSDDKAAWRPNATRTRRGAVDATGKYRIGGLLAGRYFAIALPRDRMNMPTFSQDGTYFEQLAKEATPFVVGDDEQRQLDLKITPGAGG